MHFVSGPMSFMAGEAETITVSVVFLADPTEGFTEEVRAPKNATVEEIIERSAITDKLPSLRLDEHQLGIFGQPVAYTDRVEDGDRVEIYQEILCDPKEVRRARAARKAE